MKSMFLGFALAVSGLALAQAPATAPAGSTGLCNDGTYTTAKTPSGACSRHQGVKQFFGQPTASVPEKAGTPATASSVAPPATQSPAPAPAPTPAAKPMPKPSRTIAATGDGSGQVWLNDKSKVYHCPGTKYYGKTKHGEYMTEEQAKAKGAHADHGKACS